MTQIARSLEIGDSAFGWFVLILFAVFLVHKPILQFIDDRTTPQPWITVSFEIPDHPVGDDPIVQYERTINRALNGLWSVRVGRKNETGYAYLCSGSGFSYYQPETTGPISMALSQFVGSRCTYAPGEYRACAIYDLQDARNTRRGFGPFCSNFVVNPG